MRPNHHLSRRKFIFSCGAAAMSSLAPGVALAQHVPWHKRKDAPAPITAENTVRCVRAETGNRMNLDPNDAFWQGADPIHFDRDRFGEVVAGYRSTVYTRWTDRNLHLLFACPYERLHLRPNPRTDAKTWELWKWDVAETFIGWDFDNIKSYKEFEMSPQEEYLDLDIDLTSPTRGQGMRWSSGFDVAAHIDKDKKIWYGLMKIPFPAILPPDKPAPEVGEKLRINFFRSQGPGDKPVMLAWQPPMSETFHKPAKFGTLLLVER
jgi:hypothetical protein